jgi:ABC-2 type transport system permease protein
MSTVRAATRAEFTKIISLRSIWIATGAILALHLLVQAANLRLNSNAVAAITPNGTIELFEGDPQPAHRALVDFLVASSFQMGLFLPVLAALIGGQEFRGRQLGQSVLAVPRRSQLVAAKTIAATCFLTLVSTLIAAVSTAFLYTATRTWDPGLVVSADAWRGQAKFLAFAVLTGLVSVALTLLARSTLLGISHRGADRADHDATAGRPGTGPRFAASAQRRAQPAAEPCGEPALRRTGPGAVRTHHLASGGDGRRGNRAHPPGRALTRADTATGAETGEIRLRDLAVAELTKIRTLPAGWIAFVVAFLLNTMLGFVAGTDAVRLAGAGGTTPIAQLGIVMLAPAYLLLAVPVFAAGSEYRGGQFRVSLTAVPARHRFFAAKLLVSAAATAVAALVVVIPGYVLEHGSETTAGGLAARVLAYLLLGLTGFGFAALARTVVTPIAVLLILPVLVSTTLGGLLPSLARLLPHEAMLSFLGLPANPELALARPAGLVVAAAWATLLVVLGWFATARRDS